LLVGSAAIFKASNLIFEPGCSILWIKDYYFHRVNLEINMLFTKMKIIGSPQKTICEMLRQIGDHQESCNHKAVEDPKLSNSYKINKSAGIT